MECRGFQAVAQLPVTLWAGALYFTDTLPVPSGCDSDLGRRYGLHGTQPQPFYIARCCCLAAVRWNSAVNLPCMTSGIVCGPKFTASDHVFRHGS